MKLTEFYSLTEDHDRHYTIEPDGRLLEWDLASLGDGEDMYEETSYEVIAQGHTGALLEELGRRMDLQSEDIDRIEYNLTTGCPVTVFKRGTETIIKL